MAGLTISPRIGLATLRTGLFTVLVILVACSPASGPTAPSTSTAATGTASTVRSPGPSGTAAAPTPPAGSDVEGSIESGGIKRTYVLHLPPASTRLQPTPLVAAFHGWPMSATRLADVTHLAAVADAHGFAVLFPQGYGDSWSVPGGLATPAHEAGIDDVAFARDLLDAVGPTYQIDSSRVVATGISNGGHLVEALACALADHLMGIVPVAAPLPPGGPRRLQAVAIRLGPGDFRQRRSRRRRVPGHTFVLGGHRQVPQRQRREPPTRYGRRWHDGGDHQLHRLRERNRGHRLSGDRRRPCLAGRTSTRERRRVRPNEPRVRRERADLGVPQPPQLRAVEVGR